MNKIRLLSNTVIIYMLLALIWWSVLLTRNNQELMEAKISVMQENYNKIYNVQKFDITTLPEYQALVAKSQRKRTMILGEGMVFGIMLIIGIYLIQRSYFKEVESTVKQKNFLLAITHELKSPIAAINLIIQTLQKRKLNENQMAELYQNALSESTRLEKLINNLLFTTKINIEYHYNFEKTNLSELLEQYTEKFRFQYPDIHLHTSIEKELIGMVDKESFVSVVNNLLENAYKYSGENKHVEISLQSQNNLLNMTVKDRGFGIPNKEQRKVFQQFYRVGNEETRRTKGTGLGLYIVQKIVKAHKGKIRILNNIPNGSIFEITFPLKT
ncbi:MAG: HAMP domain-containing histidine kinase [Saprospiraceae bacterium]|nr:HAMP domain-containing histidine kinase [Saprospiraceae bacterium]